MLNLVFAVALAAGAPSETPDTRLSSLPPLRVSLYGLDLDRGEDVGRLADRIDQASRGYCRQHLDRLTPHHIGDPEVCRSAMADLLVAGLDRSSWRRFASRGGHRLLRSR